MTEAYELVPDKLCLRLQGHDAVNFPPEDYDVESIKASSSTFDGLLPTLGSRRAMSAQ